MHMEGTATLGGRTVAIRTVAAVELDTAPAETYALNYPGVRVANMGCARYLATGRRLLSLKTSSPGAAVDGGEDGASWPSGPAPPHSTPETAKRKPLPRLASFCLASPRFTRRSKATEPPSSLDRRWGSLCDRAPD